MHQENCLFCNIAAHQLPATILSEDEEIIAFHDIDPQAPHHFLIIPRKHIATLNDLDESDTLLAGKLMQTARRLAKQLNFADSGYRILMNCNPDGGQLIYHIHLHVFGGRKLRWPPG